jgi:hypothetical protein
VTIADTVPVASTWETCGGIGSCLLGRVELNLRNIALLASIVASIAGTILTYGAGNLYLTAHFAVCAIVSVYTFFAMKDYELISELSSALDRVKTQHQTLERQNEAIGVARAGLETTNANLTVGIPSSNGALRSSSKLTRSSKGVFRNSPLKLQASSRRKCTLSKLEISCKPLWSN